MGVHSENKITAITTASTAGLARCQPATIWLLKPNTATPPSAHRTKVPTHAARIIAVSCRSRFVASALAVWCVNTICSGIVGMRLTRENSVIKVPYSEGGILLESRCTAYISAPPAMVATISQPLCRKKVA